MLTSTWASNAGVARPPAISRSGAGAWATVLHVRQADEERGRMATKWLVGAASAIEGGHVKTGHAVVELLARSTSKAIS